MRPLFQESKTLRSFYTETSSSSAVRSVERNYTRSFRTLNILSHKKCVITLTEQVPNCGQKFSQLHESETHYNAVHRYDQSTCHFSFSHFFLSGTAALSAKSPYPPPTFWSCTSRRIMIPSSRCSLRDLLPTSASYPPALKPFGVPKNGMHMQSRITNSLLTSDLMQLSEGKRREEQEEEEGAGRREMTS